ncbi:MAG: FlgD immunoglobulin-like domain containing protein [Bacteroidota bacterium]
MAVLRIRTISRLALGVLFLPALTMQTEAQFLTSPQPGDVYKEFSRVMTATTDEWRVTDPGALHSGAQQFKPNPVLNLSIADLAGALRAEVVLDMNGGHVGTSDRRFRFNGNAWITIPPPGPGNGIPAGASGVCYLHAMNPVVPIPLSHLRTGTNTFEGTSGGQTCYNFAWGQWGWYGMMVRVYYDASKARPGGSITSPSSNSAFTGNLTVTADAQSAVGVSRVDFFASYQGYDPDGDGVYGGYQYNYHRLKIDPQMSTREHVGSDLAAPYQAVWNTEMVPDQIAGTVKLIARIRDNNGVWFVTNEVTGLTLRRDSVSVKLYPVSNMPEYFNVRATRTTRTVNFTIPPSDSLPRALSAKLILRTWNGTDAGSEPAESHSLKVNSHTVPNSSFGQDNFFSLDVIGIPVSALRAGSNSITFYYNTVHHGADVLWPGPALLVKYNTEPPTPPAITGQPSGAAVSEGGTASFTVSAAGSKPLLYQWSRNGVDIPGASLPTYTTPPLVFSDNGAVFTCRVSNTAGVATSTGALLTVIPVPPRIGMQPAGQTVGSGRTATFHAAASGSLPLTYQWQRNGTNITGATNPWYTTPALGGTDNGAIYRCLVTNPAGTVATDNAALSVAAGTPPSMLVSDDFNAASLNERRWLVQNPGVPSTLGLTGAGTPAALLSVGIPAGSEHDLWTGVNTAPRIMQAANNTDFEVEVKFQSTLSSQYQMQGVLVEENPGAFIRFDFVRRTSETRIFSATFLNGIPTTRFNAVIPSGNTLYLRVRRQGNLWTSTYSYDRAVWTLAGSYSHTLSVGRVGVFFGNAGAPSPAFTGLADYFFNTASPVFQEDGALLAPAVVSQPASMATWPGGEASFAVAAVGTPPLAYQWRRDGTDIPGAVSLTYALPGVSRSDSGSMFQCAVRNGVGEALSNPAHLSVGPHPSGFVSEDFNAFGLDPRRWTLVDPLADAFLAMTGTNTPDARLSISVPAGAEHDAWVSGLNAPRVLQAINNTDFELEAKFDSPLTEDYQIQGILIQQDVDNYLRFDFTRGPGGVDVFAGAILNGVPAKQIDLPVTISAPAYLRIRRTGDLWTQYYSTDGVAWTAAGSFTSRLAVSAAGPFAGNAGTNPPAFTALVDYVFLSPEPVVPEDGGTALDTFPPVLASIHPIPGATGFMLTWITDEPTRSVIQYGTTPACELGSVDQSGFVTAHGAAVSGLQPQTPYHFRIRAYDAAGNTAVSPVHQVLTTTPTPPVIQMWYGREQTFGRLGNPVPLVNILGNVEDANGVASLAYTLNGGPPQALSVGPDRRRLSRKGDFNMDIPYASLLEGPNRLIITAVDSQFTSVAETVTVNYVPGRSWARDYTADWTTVSRVEDAAQILDGSWAVQNGELRILRPGYDRLLCFGEQNWVDYEAMVSVTVDSLDSTGFSGFSDGPCVGFILRWPGHSDRPASASGYQPKSGFLPLGGFGAQHWPVNGGQRAFLIGDDLRLGAQSQTSVMRMGVSYTLKMRVQTVPGSGGLYSFKIWESAMPEPSAWMITDQEPLTAPQSGSLLLVAHHVHARFGTLTIRPLETASTIVSDDFSGDTLNTALWRFVNPRGDAVAEIQGTGTLEARLSIAVPGGIKHEAWSPANSAPRLMQSANNTSFEVEARFETPVTQDIQMHGILAEQDSANYVRFDFSTAGTSTRMFAGTIMNGVATPRLNLTITPADPQYMRVRRLGDSWTLLYSYDGTTWQAAPSFTHVMTVRSVGPYAGNAGTNPPAYETLVDYFFNTASPIVPEDEGVTVPPTIVTDPASLSVTEGGTGSFTVVATGTPPLSFRWQRNGVDIPGATGPQYGTPPLSVALDNGSRYRCIVTNGAGSDTSGSATLTVSLPPSTVISDDFRSGVLNTTVWTFVNPRGDATLTFSGSGTQDALVGINVPGGVSHDVWTGGNQAPRLMQRTTNTDLDLEAKFQSGITTPYQIQGILVQQSRTEFIRFDFVTHATLNLVRVFAATFTGGTPTTRINVNTVAKGVQPLTLRVTRRGDLWTLSWSQNGTAFTTAGSFSHPIRVDSVGVFAGNAGSPVPAFTALVDYFFNASAPVVPEDPMAPVVLTQPENQTVTEGQRAVFRVTAQGTPPWTYQWQKNGTDIPAATEATYYTQPAALSDNGVVFRCRVAGPYGTTWSNGARLSVQAAQPLPWWNPLWSFRIPLEVRANGFERVEKPVEVPLNFSVALASLGAGGRFNPASLRLIEVDSGHAILDTSVAVQFNRSEGYDSASNASGTLVFLLTGVTGPSAARYFQVYFDTLGTETFTPFQTAPLVAAADTASYEGQASFRVATAGGTYYYHKPGAGFASFIDAAGLDWIGYHPGGGAGGEYRGIPNAGDAFHPGYTNSSSTLEVNGPLHARIRSRTLDWQWEVVWDIFPRYARMTMHRKGASYWWLYEGTPGGMLQPSTDFVVRPSGQRTNLATSWSYDLPGEEWAYFGDAGMRRVLYVVQHEENTINDYYRQMDSLMTVFGFGRKDPCCIRYIDAVPQTFTFGFAEDSSFAAASGVIRSAYRDLVVLEGNPQLPGASGGTALSNLVSDNFNSSGLNTSLWTFTNPRGDAIVSMTGSLLQVEVPGGVSHDVWSDGNFAPRVMQSADNTNFEVEVRFASTPSYRLQIQGILVEQDAGNFIRFDFVRNALSLNAFSASFTNGVPTTRVNTPITPGTTLLLRVKRLGHQWTFSYSGDGLTWTQAGQFTHPLVVSTAGVFFGNQGDPAPGFLGQADYFMNTDAPITQASAAIVSDNFNAPALNTGLWNFSNPRSDAALSMTGSEARVVVPGGQAHDVWSDGNFAPRIMQTVGNADFEVEARFTSIPVSKFQMEGILVQQDQTAFIRFDFVRNASTLNVFAATFTGGLPTTRFNIPITGGSALLMRVKRSGSRWTCTYSTNGTSWITAGQFEHSMSVNAVGVFFGNAGSPAPEFTGRVDYFLNTGAPIPPTLAQGMETAEPGPAIPEDFFLSANYPNPFNPSTTIAYGLPEPASVRLVVYDMVGREVATLEEGSRPAGYHRTRWDGRNGNGESVGSGVYICRVEAAGSSGRTFSALRKMVLLH